MGPLSEPKVPAAVYDETYFREACAGFAEWVASEGQAVAGIYPGFLLRAGLRPGEVVVDMGTGRGELPVVAAEWGAERAYGVEYSADAVRLARQTVAAHGVGDRVEILLSDARSIPLGDATADLVCFVDVVEHLSDDELETTLREAHRLLKAGGRVVAHTAPNRLIYDVTYRVLRGLPPFRKWPIDPRNAFERAMHVNEQSLGSLRRAFQRAGFTTEVSLGDWVYTDFVPSELARRFYHLLAKVKPMARFGIGDLWAVGHRLATDTTK